MSQRGDDSLPASEGALSRVGRWLRGIQAAGFLLAGLTHAWDMWRGGWLPYHWAPLPANAFSASLVVWDPLAAGLLVWRPRAGVALALSILVANVAVNSAAASALGPMDWYDYGPLQFQTLSLGFVAGAAPLVWWSAGRPAPAARPGAAGAGPATAGRPPGR
jgi:hypothetical protein